MEFLARKLGCSRIFDSNGVEHPVTLLSIEECVIVDIRTVEKNGYSALVVGYDSIPLARANKPTKGWLVKNGLTSAFRSFKELKVENSESFKIGSKVEVPSWLKVGAIVDCQGISKGRGFTGVLKRHNMSGPPATRGTHEARRNVGSIGCRKYPGKVFKGKRLPGRYGCENVTVLNLKIVGVYPGEGIIAVRGAVPGHINSIIKIRPAIKLTKKSELQAV